MKITITSGQIVKNENINHEKFLMIRKIRDSSTPIYK